MIKTLKDIKNDIISNEFELEEDPVPISCGLYIYGQGVYECLNNVSRCVMKTCYKNYYVANYHLLSTSYSKEELFNVHLDSNTDKAYRKILQIPEIKDGNDWQVSFCSKAAFISTYIPATGSYSKYYICDYSDLNVYNITERKELQRIL